MGWISKQQTSHCKPMRNKRAALLDFSRETRSRAARPCCGVLHISNNFIGELGRAYLACALHFAGKIAGHALG
jgi:hypothetical protein